MPRYALTDVVTLAGQPPERDPGLWLLIPMEANGLPDIGSIAVPVISQ
jgi:hypothetical protein